MFTNEQLSKIFSQPPYEPPVSSSPRTPVKLRKADLKVVSLSPFKKQDQENYCSGPFSIKARDYKVEGDLTTGRNYSAVIFESPNSKNIRYTEAHTSGPPGGPHAELKALAKLPKGLDKRSIRMLYTERKCCPNCHPKLKQLLDSQTVVVHTCHYTPDAKRQRRNEARFREVQAEKGVRDSSCRKNLFAD